MSTNSEILITGEFDADDAERIAKLLESNGIDTGNIEIQFRREIRP